MAAVINTDSALLAVANEDVKLCKKCGSVKPLHDFRNNKSKKDGKSSCCSMCQDESQNRYHKKNRAKYLEYKRIYRKTESGQASTTKHNNSDRHRELSRLRTKDMVAMLHDKYLKDLLRQMGIPKNQQTPKLLEMKKFQIETKRMSRQIKQELKK
jgi:hypothetical protein